MQNQWLMRCEYLEIVLWLEWDTLLWPGALASEQRADRDQSLPPSLLPALVSCSRNVNIEESILAARQKGVSPSWFGWIHKSG